MRQKNGGNIPGGLGVRLSGAGVRRGGADILCGIDWTLRPGESWAVFGANGAGKSTFLALARGDIWPSTGARSFIVEGREQLSPLGFRERTAFVSAAQQMWYARSEADPAAWEVVLSGLDDGPLPYGEVDEEGRAAALRALAQAGLAKYAERPFAGLSQGQQRRILLARALVGRPCLLFLDECLEGLDAPARADMLDMLRARAGRGTQLVCATHRPEEAGVLPLDWGLVLEKGCIVFQGPLPVALAAAFPPGPRASRRSRPAVPCPVRKTAAFLLALEGVSVARGGAPILSGLTWTVRPGEHWVVTGENGAGKSTLLALAAGDLHPASGRAGRFGSFRPLSLWAIRKRAALVSFDLDVAHDRETTGLEIVVSGLRGHIGLHEAADDAETARAAALLDDLGLSGLAERTADTLSTGELRRLLLARALVGEPELLLLDEPFAGLDAASRREMRRILAVVAGLGATLIMASHHADDLPDVPMRELRLGD